MMSDAESGHSESEEDWVNASLNSSVIPATCATRNDVSSEDDFIAASLSGSGVPLESDCVAIIERDSEEEDDWVTISLQSAASSHQPPPSVAESAVVPCMNPKRVSGVSFLNKLQKDVLAKKPDDIPDDCWKGTALLAKIVIGGKESDSTFTLGSMTTLAHKCSIRQEKVKTHLHAVAEAVHSSKREAISIILARIAQAVRVHRINDTIVQMMFVMRVRKYDGTRVYVNATYGEHIDGTLVDRPVEGKLEVFSLSARIAVGLRMVGPGVERGITLSMQIPVPLQTMESPNGECIVDALKPCGLPCDVELDNASLRQVDLVLRDDASGNRRAERYNAEKTGRSHAELACTAHKQFAVPKQGFALVPVVVPNANRTALSLRGDIMNEFLTECGQILEEQLVVVLNSCRPAATEHRCRVYDHYLPTKTPTDKKRKTTIEMLWNGDIRRHGVQVHHEQGCCRSVRHTLYQMKTVGLKSLFHRRLRKIDITDWGDTKGTMADLGLPLQIHGLFVCAYFRIKSYRAINSVRINPDADLLSIAADAHVADGGLADAVRDGHVEDAHAADDGELPGWDTTDRELPKQPLHKESIEERVGLVKAWLTSGTAADDLFVCSSFFGECDHLILQQLEKSGQKWVKAQQAEQVAGRERTYAAWSAYDRADEIEFQMNVTRLIFDEDRWQSLVHKTEAASLKIFQIGNRMLATCYELCFKRHSKGPYETLTGLRDPSILDSINSRSPHTVDTYTAGLLEFYDNNLHALGAQLELQAILDNPDDTSAQERMNGELQRKQSFRVWTHSQDIESLSAFTVGSEEAKCRRWTTYASVQERKTNSSTKVKRVAVRATRRRCSSWTWGVFQSINLDGYMTPEVATN